jgi:large subunit ribosomal protein L3
MKFILGRKLGMSTIYDEQKGALNVTLIECSPNVVTQIRNAEKDKYTAIQVGLPKIKTPSAAQALAGKQNPKLKAKKKFFKIREFKADTKDRKAGDEIKIDQFEIGDKVKVSGITKAKGFQGVVKRHGFAGSPKTHGHKHDLRAPGSIGATFPEHVIKGKRMAGRMGGVRASVRGLKIVEIDKENNILFLKGAVPGVKGRLVEIVG